MEVFSMAKLEIKIDDGILAEAEKILHSLGMDVEMAVSIYLRRIALEKGLPMTMTGLVSKQPEPEITEDFEDSFEDDSKAFTLSNSRITTAMVDEVWHAFLRHIGGSDGINPLSTEVSLKTGMNRGSAFIYLTVLSKLVNGDPNTRVLKYKDLEYLMGKIQTELGESKYQKALKSLMASVPYWREKIPGSFADKVEAYCKKHS
jgi:addiction module RelB/DinJ family antitoxin